MEKRKENTVDVLLKHILRQFLRGLEIDEKMDAFIDKKAYVALSEEEFKIIKRYLASKNVVEEVAIREGVRAALDRFLVVVSFFFAFDHLNF